MNAAAWFAASSFHQQQPEAIQHPQAPRCHSHEHWDGTQWVETRQMVEEKLRNGIWQWEPAGKEQR